MTLASRVYVAGHLGMVGRAICGALTRQGHIVRGRHRSILDLRDSSATLKAFREDKPTHVVLAAALVGGIMANATSPADFISSNLAIQSSVIEAAHAIGVKRLLFLGSSCIYPRLASQPIPEEALLTGPLEETNRAYAIAKIAGVEMLRAYRTQHGLDSVTVMPSNLYGPWDNFEPWTSHVVPGIMRKMHRAKILGEGVTLWGSGTPRRELLHVDDCADACVRLLDQAAPPALVNVGAGSDLSILDLATLIAEVVGFTGTIAWDASKPDGTPRKLLDVTRIRATGWAPIVPLRTGLEHTYRWYLQHGETS